MDQIINYLLLTIIFVFDPLAIALVIAANFAFSKLIPKTRENLYGEKVEIKEDNGWDSTLNDGLDDDEDGESILNVNSPGVTLPGEEEIEDSKESEIVELYNNGFPKGYASESSEEQKVREDKLLDTSSTSGWRKNKILNERAKENPEEDNDLTIKY